MALADLGTSKIALTVAKVTGENTEVLYYRETPSDGIRYGSIFNPMKAAESLRKSVENAENELGIKIRQLITNMPRGSVRQESSPAQIERSDPYSCISSDEVDALKNITLDSYPLEDPQREEIYGAVAQSFSTDDMIHASEEDIVGVCSERLDGNFRIFIGAKKPVDNIFKASSLLDLAIAGKVFTPDAVGRAVLNEGELENGVGLIEIGCGVTSVSIFENNILRYYSSIPFGGGIVTNDIKMECNIKGALAENIKLAFGACQPDKLQTMSEKILMLNNEELCSSHKLPVKYLSEIITARMKEILQSIFFLIQSSGYADRLRSGLVVTGGGANLLNCVNFIKDESGYNVRLGFPHTSAFSQADCEGFGALSSTTSVAMLLACKDDPYLNCLESAPAPARAEESGAAEEETAQDGAGVPDGAEVMPEQETDEVGERRKKKEETGDIFAPVTEAEPKTEVRGKGREKENKPGFLVKWGSRIGVAIGEIWDSSIIGKSYEEME